MRGRYLCGVPVDIAPGRDWLSMPQQCGVVCFAAMGSGVPVCRQRDEVTWREQTHLDAGQLCIGDALALGCQLSLSKVLQAGS